ncbi:ABC transporter permease [Methanogenium sp. S4BF]|uniref:ABC transporter permease n=1 Tax=Methanogenium sp. S4BF TaxID=1789226 RepID=UPI002415C375|nr:ABC transporter permease [Methanogenium sp. S4BF]WFN33934.1 ABC transporter permease [Methanogenium sp. S4BF]
MDLNRSEALRRVEKAAVALGISVLFGGFLLFITVPVISLFLRISPEAFIASLSTPVVTDALILSLTTAVACVLIVVLCGTPISYINARFAYRGKDIIDTLIDIPVILPPAVAGLALLMAFGRYGIVGKYLSLCGIEIAYTTLAVVLAQVFVSSPFYIRQARAGFEAVDTSLEDAARTLGASPLRTFARITMPLAAGGLISGAVMTFARALGEFGATIMFAGNIQGRTQTMPLAIYTTMQGDLDASLALAVILVIISFGVITGVRYTLRRGASA